MASTAGTSLRPIPPPPPGPPQSSLRRLLRHLQPSRQWSRLPRASAPPQLEPVPTWSGTACSGASLAIRAHPSRMCGRSRLSRRTFAPSGAP
eukprot:13579636-Alexandrium_andersonii.AAC.1